jgi:ankyrin repeat protein
MGHLEVARLLLEAGADASRADSDGRTPLMHAAGQGKLEVLRLLLALDPAPDPDPALDSVHPGSGWTAFHAACGDNHPDCAEALALAGCDVGIKDSDGKTGRQLAEQNGCAAVVERLRALGAERAQAVQAAAGSEPQVAPSGKALGRRLWDTVKYGCDAAAVARLLAAGADPNALVTGRNASGGMVQSTALEAAAGQGWLEAARLLLDGGADPSLAGSTGSTPLMGAAANGQVEVLRLLLERGAAMDAVDPNGATAFHGACYTNQAECAEALARGGCDVGLKAKHGVTGLHLAERYGHAAVVARLQALAVELPRLAELQAELQALQATAGSEPEMAPSEKVLRGQLIDAATKVRKPPSWPRSWANSSLS